MQISAIHGTGTGDLLDEVVARLPHLEQEETESGAVSVAIVGRPNAGKSSLLNKLARMERSVVSETAGTTRDSVDTLIALGETTYRFVDTAGLRKRSKVDEPVEYYGFVRALRALDRCDVALVVLDASLGVGDADQKVADYASSRKCATIIVINKRDLLAGDDLREFREEAREKLRFIRYSPLVSVSAKTGQGTGRLPEAIDRVTARYRARISTSQLNAFVGDIKTGGHTVSKAGKALKLKYATQVGVSPPVLCFFVNQPRLVTEGFRRYLENRLRDTFGFEGTPVLLRFRSAK